MPLRQTDAIVLRTYPLKESDRIVVFFTREYGKRRGVSRGARNTRSRFGSALEPLTEVRITYFERPQRELATIDHCELRQSLLASGDGAGFERLLALGCIAEVSDRILPDHETNDAAYRLLRLVLEALRSELPVWLPLTYFLYWMVRLGGFLPDLEYCAGCRRGLGEAESFYARGRAGLYCSGCRPPHGSRLRAAPRRLAAAGLAGPLAALPPEAWQAPEPTADLREFFRCALEDHLEAPLRSWPLLAGLTPETAPPKAGNDIENA